MARGRTVAWQLASAKIGADEADVYTREAEAAKPNS
jgi:hypothetical protein